MKDDVQDAQNKTFAQQRRVLRAILDEGEQKVPSTAASIIAAIRQEPREVSVEKDEGARRITPVVPFPQKHEIETPMPRRTRRTLYSVFAFVAVAVVLIASFGLFSSLAFYRSASMSGGSASTSSNSAGTGEKPSSSVASSTTTWSAVIVIYQVNHTMFITNYDPLSEKYEVLATSLYVNTSVDGVSHDGQQVLYSVYDGLKTAYYVYPQSTTMPVYIALGKSSSAVWSTDDKYIFISTMKGIAQVDVKSHSTHLILPMLAATKLLNYRDDNGYLYFIKGYKGQAYDAEGTLNRVNLASGNVQQITSCGRGANFWLSPGGVTVYYTCPDTDATELYAVDSDGTNSRVLGTNIENVIGYAVDGSPLALMYVNGKYQVVQQDLNTAQQTVVLADVAHGATKITASDVAVAPGGHTLIAKGTYSGNGTVEEQFWYGDVDAGTSHMIQLPQGVQILGVIGWDRLQVPENMLTSTP